MDGASIQLDIQYITEYIDDLADVIHQPVHFVGVSSVRFVRVSVTSHVHRYYAGHTKQKRKTSISKTQKKYVFCFLLFKINEEK